eukprot:2445029-Rhodomonas_salina.1
MAQAQARRGCETSQTGSTHQSREKAGRLGRFWSRGRQRRGRPSLSLTQGAGRGGTSPRDGYGGERRGRGSRRRGTCQAEGSVGGIQSGDSLWEGVILKPAGGTWERFSCFHPHILRFLPLLLRRETRRQSAAWAVPLPHQHLPPLLRRGSIPLSPPHITESHLLLFVIRSPSCAAQDSHSASQCCGPERIHACCGISLL